MNETDTNDELMIEAKKLATEVSPERDLWPDIAGAITAPQRSRWTPRFAQAAAVVLLMGASSLLTFKLTGSDEPTIVEVTPADLAVQHASFGGHAALGVEYHEVRRDLAAQLEAELSQLSPETRAEVNENLAMIRAAIAQIDAALAEDPDNRLLQELLLQTYQEELAMMQRVGGLTKYVMSRRDF